jgi:hypothetical protein
MEQEKIKELLDRYYEGLTSEEEEALLKELFNTEDLSAYKGADGALFTLSTWEIPEPSEDFIRNLNSVATAKTSIYKSGKTIRYILSAAAGVALLVTSYYIFTDTRSSAFKDTYSDPELALAEVRNVLGTVSQNMKAGTEPLNSISTMNIAPKTINEIGKMNKTVNSSLEKLRYLNKLETSSQTSGNNKQ